MPIQLSDDLFEHLTPPESVEWHLPGVSIPRDNKAGNVVLLLQYCGRGSKYLTELAKLKPLADKQAATERALALFAKHGVVGWKNVDDEGKPAPYDQRVCADLLIRILRARGVPGTSEMDSMIGYAQSPSVFFRMPEARELGEE